ncbi:MAG: hypothetical protein ABW321_09350 [Polyangiales bacterium]
MLAIWVAWSLARGAIAAAQVPDDRAELDRGMAAFNAGRFEAAAAAFDASYRLKPSPATLYQLAVTYAALGQPRRAYDAYEQLIRGADSQTDPTQLANATREKERIQTTVGRFTLKLSPPQALIHIDGNPAFVKENEVWLLPGKHAIALRAQGFESYTQTIDVQTGRFALEINLRQPSVSPPEQAAALVDDGMMLAAQGDVSNAVLRFQEAEQVYSTPRGLAQLGLAEERAGEMASAEDHITAALAAKKDPYIKKNAGKLKTALTRIMRSTKDYAKLQISGSPPGARLYLGERAVGTLAVTSMLRVPAGRVTVYARLDGFADAIFEADLPRRSLRQIELKLSPLPPPPPPAPPPRAAPEPVAVEPEPEPVAPEPTPEPAPERVSQVDIETLRDQSEVPDGKKPATGFELNVAVGYQFWLGKGPWNSKGGPALRLSLGARVPWPISFGISLIDMSADFGNQNTNALFTLSPGVYVRGHSQRYRKLHSIDVWGGVGFVPIAFALASFDDDTTTQERLAGVEPDEIGEHVAENLGIGKFVTRQSMNIPIELGVTWFATRGVGVTLNAAFTFWLPQQLCYHGDGDRYCISEGLSSQRSLFVGAGVYFLP